MDVFAFRDRLVRDYAAYIESFTRINDRRIQELVEQELQAGLLWPDALLQLNPTFEAGPWIDALVDEGALHPLCRSIFRIKPADMPDKPLRLHAHQADAIRAAQSGDNYVLTTGTGSGKSLAYIIPIVDHVLRHGSGRGIRAIVVYPTNALANSQFIELGKFLGRGIPAGAPSVTFHRYTGQETDEQRDAIIANPPDIILTNYVMLELMLTRPREHRLVEASRGLQFLVLDELHTYRGRQGADVALLVRRVREACASPGLQCIGTSATLAGPGTLAEQQQEIARVATRLFGSPVKPERVISETLRRATDERDHSDPTFVAQLTEHILDVRRDPPREYKAFVAEPLSSWIESMFGLATESASGRLHRAAPIPITGPDGAAKRLSELTKLPEADCIRAIQGVLLGGYKAANPDTGFPAFAFRLHQFISRGDTVYASLESPDQRHLSTRAQQYVPGDRNRLLLPLAFCLECGQEYYTVEEYVNPETGERSFRPRNLTDQSGSDDATPGFLYQNPENPWPEETASVMDRLPDDWLESAGDATRIRRDHRDRLPRSVHVDPCGREQPEGTPFQFMRSPFGLCLNCGVAYSSRQRSDLGKLTTLASGGRSTATTVLSLSALRWLRREDTLKPEARKLLSFTDNRQDASLQAGHFNDFVEVGLLRAALYKAVAAAGTSGLKHDDLPQHLFETLNLDIGHYAADPTVRYQARVDTDAALRDVLAYRIYHDLRRGWRVTAPNLEQCGLLEIHYASLKDLCSDEELWQGHPALASASPEDRARIAHTLLDFLRRSLAIKVDYLEPSYQERMQQRSSQRLREPWAIDENEVLQTSAVALPRSRRPQDSGGNIFVSGRSGFGLYLRRSNTFPNYRQRMTLADTEILIRQLFEVLRVAGLVTLVQEADGEQDTPGYQVPASCLIWRAGDGRHPLHDPIRIPRLPQSGARVNSFFVDFYQTIAAQLVGIQAREHTAQVPNKERQDREEHFRKAELPVLYCSPTMELGVDIAELNAVNMRNVPPTPANYAQRSGRAGRSGQPALVFTYCTTGSPHDQYFFRRPERMVSGAVAPPRLDLANEDLVRAHVHSIWLSETGRSLGSSLKDVLDLSGDEPTLEVLPSVREDIESEPAKRSAYNRAAAVFNTLDEVRDADWYHEDWLAKTLDQAASRFDAACDRWRGLYRAAVRQREQQHRVIIDHNRSSGDRQQATRLRAEAEAQLTLLTGGDGGDLYQSDFYSYRYFASEGFLPGYSFPRLPLSAYIPGRRTARGTRDEFLSRPRFLAISEFGPRSIIYHEGSTYVVNKAILPVDQEALITRAKFCPNCGYLHPLAGDDPGPDLCEYCGASLGHPLRSLFRMRNASTRRRDRINSDEEERVRMGYDLRTGVRFTERGEKPSKRVATVVGKSGSPLLQLTYGSAATLWRINQGWRKRRNPDVCGFVLDLERGYWQRNQDAEDDQEDPMSPRTQRVIPFVEDRRNSLLIEPLNRLSTEEMASLQQALKNAIQVLYQLEDAELAAEPLPDAKNRRLILLHEAAEGGAGVLRQLLDRPDAVADVAREALILCHFDPATGADLRRAPRATEDCEAACYDCLMSYSNQPDHHLLDRQRIRGLLLELAGGTVSLSPGPLDRAEHLRRLKAVCDSDLEREWLDFLESQNLRLPDAAQHLIEACHTRPDFLYREQAVAIYIDGPDHDIPDIAARDREVTERLENEGFTVLRFGYRKAEWPAICTASNYLFGAPSADG